jgi:thymidylate synthase ThyX
MLEVEESPTSADSSLRETRPEVFLIARPSVDVEGMRRYLESVGGESWLELRTGDGAGPLNSAEQLIEFAGRVCYRSWEPGLNPNVGRIRTDQREYFENILRSGHGSVLEHANYSFALRNVSRVFCYDEQTEVLTSEGWKRWPDVDGTELFGTLNPSTDELEYQPADERFMGAYEGPMYRVQSEQVDLLVTPDHRMWVRPEDTQARRRNEEPFQIRLAHEIAGKRVSYQKTARWTGQEEGVVEIDGTERSWVREDTGTTTVRTYAPAVFPLRALARFLGWWLAEGSLNRHQIVIAQSPGEKRDEICAIIEDLGLKPYVPRDHPSVRTNNVALRDFLAGCGGAAHTKRVPPIVGTWGPQTIREFLEAFIDGDGSRRKTGGHSVIYTTSRAMADDLQVLAIKAGWSANVRVDDRTGLERVMPSGQRFRNRRPCYIVSLVKTRTRPLVNHNRPLDAGSQDHMEWYRGMVHCVRVPNGLLFVRRNGKPCVSGNTHELVRHRAGSAFSQESLRYVRLKDIGFRIPEVLEPVRDQVVSIVEQLEEFQVSAAEELGIDEDGLPFHVKKEITSALRRLAPIGLSTDIVWTANVRTLRHVIEMRTAPGAEEELRSVFDEVAQVMRREAPGLFQDFSRGDDGTWTPEHRKV